MLTETGTIIAVGRNFLWIEVIQQSTCGSCSAQKGCGQGVLSKYLSGAQRIKVQIDAASADSYSEGSSIELSIDEDAVVRGAALVYLLPLACLILGAVVGGLISEPVSILLAIAGLIAGARLTNRIATERLDDPMFSPVIVDQKITLRILN